MVSILDEELERKVVKPRQMKLEVMQSKINKYIWTSSTWIHHIRWIRMKGGRGGRGAGVEDVRCLILEIRGHIEPR